MIFLNTFTNQHRLLKSAKDASMLHREACLGELTQMFCQTDSYIWSFYPEPTATSEENREPAETEHKQSERERERARRL